jgi:hypothetical protein
MATFRQNTSELCDLCFNQNDMLMAILNIEMIYTKEQLESIRHELYKYYSKIDNYILIEEGFNILIYEFDLLNEEQKKKLSFSVHNMKEGIKKVFEAEDELDILKLAEGSNLIKCFLKFAKYF